jgi:DNA-binding MarR family transcriptional regulator
MKKYPVPPQLEAGFRMAASLNSDEHWAVYISLMKHDASSVAWLADEFKGTYHEISLIVDDLEKGGLVETFPIWEDEVGGDLARIYCRVTTAGLILYARLMEELILAHRPRSYYMRQDRRHEAIMKEIRAGL